MKGFFRSILFIFAFCPLYLFAQNSHSDNLIHVVISGLHSDRGQVVCSLYSSAEGFPKDAAKALARTQSRISSRQATCEFKNLSPGTYAVSVFHDENSNGKLDTKLLGIPREGVGASNDAKGRFGPPKFSAAAFQFTGGNKELTIKIVYL